MLNQRTYYSIMTIVYSKFVILALLASYQKNSMISLNTSLLDGIAAPNYLLVNPMGNLQIFGQ